ncbi:hypothetical protein LEM8419_00973 [Neolewinella maritima]|uniref:DUF4386 family protein n=1 Tax=Neolewinella maritima TaxID=1383882 RepID=A0ABM9AZP1_9BACT|nr:hypothetical protein [Neolewinella maritima]CAH0999673.1 hypothetical protein LEM8419_00973 [Neolewinella maritima]
MRTPLTLLLVVFLCTCVPAQELLPPETGVYLERVAQQRGAMLLLGGWAVGNIGLGLVLRANGMGEARRFHEMNAIWNTVNLGIAGFGLYAALREPATMGAFDALRANVGFQKVLLFNAGLDVGYIMGGLYLMERGRRPEADTDRLRGYGKAVILQGSFLFAFDLINYFIASGRTAAYGPILGAVGEGIGLRWVF